MRLSSAVVVKAGSNIGPVRSLGLLLVHLEEFRSLFSFCEIAFSAVQAAANTMFSVKNQDVATIPGRYHHKSVESAVVVKAGSNHSATEESPMFSTICSPPCASPGLVVKMVPLETISRLFLSPKSTKRSALLCLHVNGEMRARGDRCTLLDGQPTSVTSYRELCAMVFAAPAWRLAWRQHQRGRTQVCSSKRFGLSTSRPLFRLAHQAALRVEAPSLQQSLGVVHRRIQNDHRPATHSFREGAS